MRLTDGFIVRDIAGETVAIPSGAAAGKLSGLIALNDSGKDLFELLQTEQTVDSLTGALLAKYDIDEATARADVLEFLDIFRRSGVLIED
ncbi:MAG: PqqD family protein [Ruminococcus sp.]|nr:PqqD family protein [Ruminococcus sp.]